MDAQVIEQAKMQKKRKKTELPTSLDDGNGHMLLSAMTIENLIEKRFQRVKSLEDMETQSKLLKEALSHKSTLELELRAINAEIRKRL